jgi:DNA-directed RNA polymerase specialized sigma24 family protein
MSGGLIGLTNGQLAEVLEVTPKAASQAGYRARRKLAAALPRAA